VTIAKHLSVSQEAVRKWFCGASKPRPNAMKALAMFLDVPYVWLALGTDHQETAIFRDMASKQDACLYAYVSYVLNQGGSVAFNKDGNDTSDLTVIIEGEVSKISVFSPVSVIDGKMEFKLTQQSGSVKTVCACQVDGFDTAYDFIELEKKVAMDYAKREKNYVINYVKCQGELNG